MALVKIDAEFAALIPKLRPEEYAQLEASILRHGCRDNLKVWLPGDIVIDGHNRHRICKQHGIPFGITPIELADRDAVLLWIEENQLGRRNLSDHQRADLLVSVASRRSKAATDRQRKEAAQKPRKKISECTDTAHPLTAKAKKEPKRTLNEVAKENNIPANALRTARKIRDAAPELADKVRAGEMTQGEAKKILEKDKPAPVERSHFPQKPIETITQAKPERKKSPASLNKQRNEVIAAVGTLKAACISLEMSKYLTATGFNKEDEWFVHTVCDTVTEAVKQLRALVSPPLPRGIQDEIPATPERLQ
jgi:hypothetical protein